MVYLSLDFGTSSLKIAIVDKTMNIVESYKETYNYNIPNTNWVEIDPKDIINALVKALKKITTNLNKIEAICYDTFSPSIVLMDSKGKPLYPIITHLDRRSINESKYICKHFGLNNFKNITGILPFPGGTSITTLLWVKNNLKNIYNQSYKIGHLNTFIHHYLTGYWVTDNVNASMSGMYNTITQNGWNKDLMSAFELSIDKLPEIQSPGKIFGYLNNSNLTTLGLLKGIPVTIGTNDIAASQIGANNQLSGDILIVSGSSEMISILSDTPIIDNSHYLRCSANSNLWQIFAITASGFAFEWIRKEMYREIDINLFYTKVINDALEKGERNIIYLPYITGDRQSLKVKKALFNGIDLNTTRDNMLASMIKGIHVPILNTLKMVENRIKLNKQIIITGGLSNNKSLYNYKKSIFTDYDIKITDDCPIIGNIKLYLNNLI